jgi:hypothetical protein
MADQIPLIMLVMLTTIGIFLIPWRMISERINKGPAYALGLSIASVAIIGAFLHGFMRLRLWLDWVSLPNMYSRGA